MSFHHLSVAAADRLLQQDFGSRIAGLSANPAASVAASGSVVRYLGSDRAQIQTSHGLALETSSVPLRVASNHSAPTPVSLRLHEAGSAFVATNPLQSFSVSHDLAGGVTVGADGIELLPEGSDVPGSLIDSEGVLFANSGPDEDTVIAPTIRGADVSTVLRSRLSPQEISDRLVLPSGAQLQASGGGASIVREGKPLASVPAPVALDAQGTAVRVTMTVSGDTLLLTVSHRDRDVAYPILVDPELNIGGASASSSGLYPEKEPCFAAEGECGAYFGTGSWGWSEGGPVYPATGPERFKTEFEAVGFSAGTPTGHPEDASWFMSGYCGTEAVGGIGGYSSEPPESTETTDMGECKPTEARAVQVSVTTGQNEAFFVGEPVPQIKASAGISVGAILLSESLPVGAEPGSEMYGSANEGEPGRSDCLLGQGVNCATGNETIAQTDLEVGGRGPGLHIERTYNSQLAVAESEAGGRPGPFGYGWTSSYSAYLEAGAGTAVVHQDDGSTVTFIEEGEEHYVATSPLVQAKLARHGTEWAYTLPDQTTLWFNAVGLLRTETDRNGNSVYLSYENDPCSSEEDRSDARIHPDGTIGGGECKCGEESHSEARPRPAAVGGGECPATGQRLETIEDPQGRKITLTYNSEGQVATATDPMGHTVHYGYEEHNLSAVTEPGETEATWQFKYDSSHQLTSQTDALGHTATTEYESHRVSAQTDPQGHKRKWSFGTETVVHEPNGSETTATLNAAGLTLSLTTAAGTSLAASTTYEYDGSEDLSKTTNPEGKETTYGYDAEGNKTSETGPLGHTFKWTYDSTHDVSSVTTPNSETTTYTRNSQGDVTKSESPAPGGTQTTKYEYDSEGDMTSMTDPLGRTTKDTYDAYGDLASEKDPEGNEQTFTYDEDSQEISATSPLGNVSGGNAAQHTTTIKRDEQGQAVTVTEPPTNASEIARRLEYLKEFGSEGAGPDELSSPAGLALDSSGNVWIADTKNSRVEEFNEKGEYLQAFGTKGAGSGQLNSPDGIAIDQHGNVWVADTKNNRIEEFNAKGEYLTRFGAKGAGPGQLNSPDGIAIDQHGNIWVADTKNNRIEELSETGEYLQAFGTEGTGPGQLSLPAGVALDSSGNVWVADTKNSRVEEFNEAGEYLQAFGTKGSGIGQLNSPDGIAIDQHGNIWVADTKNSRVDEFSVTGEYLTQFGSKGSGAGQLSVPGSVAIDPSGDAWVADTGNNRIQEWVPGSTRSVYAAGGLLESVTDPDGQTTSYTYNDDDQPTKVTLPNGTTEETNYDTAGQVISHTDGNGHTTKYVRNALEQVTEVEDPLGRKTITTYDKAGHVATVTDPEGRVTTNTYNAGGQLTNVSYSDGKTPAVEYTYDPDGNRTSMTDGTGTTKYAYDQLDRLSEVETGHKETTKYEYNLGNQQTKITYPNGKSVEHGYSETGHLASVTDWLGNTTHFAYNAESSPTVTTFPTSTGETDTYSYNPANQITGITFAKGTKTLASLAYTRNNDGEVTQTTSKSLPGETTTADGYDQNNRLTTGGATTYEYDPAGNPTKTGTTTNTFNAADEISSSAGTTYTYNEEGSRTLAKPASGPATTYTYDQAGNLTSVARPAEGSTPKIEDTYVYNGEGLRTSETDSGTTKYLTWDLAEQPPLLLSDGTNSYIYGPEGNPIEQISSSGTVLYLHHDQQGSTRMLTTTKGAIAGTTTYDAYGNLTGSTGTSTTPLGYDGQYTDADTGLIYLRARDYDPSTAQFLTQDPEVASTFAPYTYAGDNPVTQSDPTGQVTEGECAGVSVQLVTVNLAGGECAVRAKASGYSEEIGLTETSAGGGGAGLDGSGSVDFQVSNARRVGGLAGPFYYANIGGEYGVGLTGTAFWSLSTSPFFVYGIELGAAVGGGADIAAGVSDTTIHKEGGWKKDAIKFALDVTYDHESSEKVLKRAIQLIRPHL
jgi:RHS repeat-associated protein